MTEIYSPTKSPEPPAILSYSRNNGGPGQSYSQNAVKSAREGGTGMNRLKLNQIINGGDMLRRSSVAESGGLPSIKRNLNDSSSGCKSSRASAISQLALSKHSLVDKPCLGESQ